MPSKPHSSWTPPLLITQVCNSILSISFLTTSNSASFKLLPESPSLAKPRIHFYLSEEPEEGKNSLGCHRQWTAWNRTSTTVDMSIDVSQEQGSFLTWPSKGSKHCMQKTLLAQLGSHTPQRREAYRINSVIRQKPYTTSNNNNNK